MHHGPSNARCTTHTPRRRGPCPYPQRSRSTSRVFLSRAATSKRGCAGTRSILLALHCHVRSWLSYSRYAARTRRTVASAEGACTLIATLALLSVPLLLKSLP